jgi:hypothetical protein
MPGNPLAEVFGFTTEDQSDEARRHREHRLCPFNNKVPNCTKVRAINPLGVCSVRQGSSAVITCPIRFRQDWIITNDAARFFFPERVPWTSLVEVRLDDRDGKQAGKFDIVLVSYDEHGTITDFGALEVQAVYISGNVQAPFDRFMLEPHAHPVWEGANYPRPDYLSSSRKRLAPQLMFKGGIINTWGKKQAVALQAEFYRTLPPLPNIANPDEADMVWLLYELEPNQNGQLGLRLKETIYTQFEAAVLRMTKPRVGPLESFITTLQRTLDTKLTPPDAPILTDETQHDLDPDDV